MLSVNTPTYKYLQVAQASLNNLRRKTVKIKQKKNSLGHKQWLVFIFGYIRAAEFSDKKIDIEIIDKSAILGD